MADLRDTDWRKNPRSAQYVSLIEKAAAANDVPVELLGALLHRENRFRPNGSSRAGAQGIAQIVPKFHPDVDPLNPAEAIPYAASYLADNYDRFGDWDRALAAYNYGPTNVAKLGDDWESQLPAETRDYINALSPSRVTYVEQAKGEEDELDALANKVSAQRKAASTNAKAMLAELDAEDKLAENTDPNTRGWFLDVGTAPARGAFRGLRAAYRGLYDMASKITEYTGDVGYEFGGEGFYARSPEEVKARNKGNSLASLITGEKKGTTATQSIVDTALTGAVNLYGGNSQTGTGQFVESASQFITGMAVTRKFSPTALESASRVTKTLYAIGEGALIGGAFFEAQEQNLANLIQSAPSLQNPITEYLADKGGSEAEGRLKNAISDALGGAVVEPLFAALGAWRAAVKVRALQQAADVDARIELDLGKMGDAKPAPKVEAPAPEVPAQAAPEVPLVGKTDEFETIAVTDPHNTIPDRFIMPESTVLKHPNGHIAVTPNKSGGLQITAAAASVPGTGRKLLTRAVQYAQDQGKSLTSDESVSSSQLWVYKKLKAEGVIEYDVDPTAFNDAIEKQTFLVGATPPITNIRFVDQAGASAADVAAAAQPAPHPKSFEPKTESFATDPLEVQEKNLRDRLGLTDEKVAEIRGKIERGEIQPEEVDDLINLNGDLIDWSGITDEKAAVGLWNTTARVLDDTVGDVAGHRRVSIDSVERIVTDELGGTVDEAYSLWDNLKAAGGLEARMWSARKVLAGSLAKLSNLAKRIESGNFKPEDLLELAIHDRRHALLQAVVRGSKSIVARTLRLMQETVTANESAFKLADARHQGQVRKAQEAVDKMKAKRAPGADAELGKLRRSLDRAIADADKAKTNIAKSKPEGALTDAEKAKVKELHQTLNEAIREEKRLRAQMERAAKERAAAKSVEDVLKEAKEAGRELTRSDVEQALTNMGLSERQVRKLASHYVKAGKNTAKANRVSRSVSFGQRIQERLATLYINNILSGLPTMMLNVMSFWLKMADTTVERYGAVAVKALRTGGKVDKWDFLTAHRAVMASRAMWSDSWRIAKALYGEGKIADRMEAALTDNTGAVANTLKAARTGKPVTDIISATEMDAHGGAPTSVVGQVLSLPSRLIITIDEYSKTVFYRQELHARAVEVAAAKARLVTGGGKAADKVFEAEYKRILDNPPDDLHLDAVENARYQTFQKPLESKAAQFLTRFVNGVPLARLVLPFIRTPGNIMKQALLERTPLAAMRYRVWKDIAQGSRQGDTVAIRTALAISAFAIIYDAAWEGKLTGSKAGYRANKNSADVDDEFAYGWKRDDGTVLQYSRIDPWGTVLALTTDIANLQKERERRNENDLTADDMDNTELFGAVFALLSENVLDKTYFKGLSDFIEAIEQGGDVASNYFGNIAVSLAPFASFQRNWARANDDVQREAFTLSEKLRKQTPGFRDELNVKRDVLGRPLPESARLGWDGVSPVLISKQDADPAARAYAELEIDFRMPRKNIDGIELTSQQYSQLLEVRGGFIRQHIQDRINSGEWARMPRYARVAVVQAVSEQGTRLAEVALIRDNAELGQAIRERKSAEELLRTAAE